MKLYISLILLAITLAFATGQFAFLLKGVSHPISINVKQFSFLKQKFQDKENPISLVDFTSLYNSQDFQKLISPSSSSVNNNNISDTTEYYSNKNCFENIYRYINIENYEKVWMWEEFRCSGRDFLPSSFFAIPPFMHPSGKSFTYLAFLTGKNQFKTQSWIFKNLTYFHVEELPKIRDMVLGGHQEFYDILIDLDPLFLKKLFKGDEVIFTNKYLFFKIFSLSKEDKLKYKVYSRNSFDSFLTKTPYMVVSDDGKISCLYQEYDICWRYSPRHLYKLASESTFYFFMGSLLIVSLVVWILVNKIRFDKKEEEKRRLALRVLTHEFRTPVASMLLQVEEINKYFDEMNPEAQEAILRLSGDVFRLQRLTEKSRYYLRTEHDKNLFQYNIQKIDSINEFMKNFLIPYEENLEIVFRPLEPDMSISFDSYWVGIALTNLLENGKNHGATPITVELSIMKGHLLITVKDEGKCYFNSIKEMSSPFMKGPDSQGSGLGLNIVHRIAVDMGGDIIFRKNPTRFTLKIKI